MRTAYAPNRDSNGLGQAQQLWNSNLNVDQTAYQSFSYYGTPGVRSVARVFLEETLVFQVEGEWGSKKCYAEEAYCPFSIRCHLPSLDGIP